MEEGEKPRRNPTEDGDQRDRNTAKESRRNGKGKPKERQTTQMRTLELGNGITELDVEDVGVREDGQLDVREEGGAGWEEEIAEVVVPHGRPRLGLARERQEQRGTK